MKRYAINYNRVFPDHRVPVDYHFNKQLMQGPSTYFRLLKASFNAMGVKNFHIALSFITMYAFGILGFACYYNHDYTESDRRKVNTPGYRYFVMSRDGGYGAYDNILHKFEKEQGGIRDLPWE